MKRLVCTAVLLAGFLCLFAAEPQAEIKFDKASHNFGSFSESNPIVSCIFKFKNTGKAPLVINQAIASCGCTVPTFTEKPISPGDSGVVKVTYNGQGRYPGRFKKVVTVMSNAKSRLVRLYIEGNMTEDNKKKK